MKKRHNMVAKSRFANSGRRRQLLKRLHQKMNIRRQQFQLHSSNSDFAEAC
ncbi:hypothetical protein [Paraglaciecola hydrolytica]|uniref:hypothetical protein n=1 Tax=Paraglaciecola hydrolytica TaxID=1799789 RepID=UPI000B28079A|nr:hypothetical protein [Paraglaciecola hydrolytica]